MFLTKCSPSGNVLWLKEEGGTENDRGYDIAFDGSNVNITGWFKGTANFSNTNITSNGDADIFIAQYDTNGNLNWINHAGGVSGVDYGTGIYADQSTGDIYATGRFEGTMTLGTTTLTSTGGTDLYLAKYNNSGNTVSWVAQGTGTGSFNHIKVVEDGFDELVVFGSFTGEAVLGSANYTVSGWETLTARFQASDGSVICSEQLGLLSSGSESLPKISTDGGGTTLFAGTFEGSITFGVTSSLKSDVLLTSSLKTAPIVN